MFFRIYFVFLLIYLHKTKPPDDASIIYRGTKVTFLIPRFLLFF